MATSRETARDALVDLLTTALVGVGLPVKSVLGYPPDTLAEKTPLVSVLSRYSRRTEVTFMGNLAEFGLVIAIWVLQSDVGWSHADAEDAIDDIEARIAEVFESDMVNRPIWEILRYDGDTTVFTKEIPAVHGVPYYLERIPVLVKLVTN